MMRKIHCLNAISRHGTDLLTEEYELTERPEAVSYTHLTLPTTSRV